MPDEPGQLDRDERRLRRQLLAEGLLPDQAPELLRILEVIEEQEQAGETGGSARTDPPQDG